MDTVLPAGALVSSRLETRVFLFRAAKATARIRARDDPSRGYVGYSGWHLRQGGARARHCPDSNPVPTPWRRPVHAMQPREPHAVRRRRRHDLLWRTQDQARRHRCAGNLSTQMRLRTRPRQSRDKSAFGIDQFRAVWLVNRGGRDEDRYGRKLRTVERNGRSLGEILIAEGLARRWGGARHSWCG